MSTHPAQKIANQERPFLATLRVRFLYLVCLDMEAVKVAKMCQNLSQGTKKPPACMRTVKKLSGALVDDCLDRVVVRAKIGLALVPCSQVSGQDLVGQTVV